jgi:hypothetical protein
MSQRRFITMSSDAGMRRGNVLGVRADRRSELTGFFVKESISLIAGSEDEGLVRIAGDGNQLECSLEVLYPGGWIRCPVARNMAAKLSVKGKDIGKLMDFLEIKIRDCELGCFK